MHIHSTKIYSRVYWKIWTTLELTVSWLKRKSATELLGTTSLLCGPELKLLSLYLRLMQPKVKISGLFCLMFPRKFTFATYTKYIITSQSNFENSSWSLPHSTKQRYKMFWFSNWLKLFFRFKCYCEFLIK